MASITAICPPLNQLYELIDKVPKFPINNRQLVSFASKLKVPKEVIDFYKSFGDHLVYDNREELAVVSEQVDLLRQSGPEMPQEIERSPEEY